MAARLGLFLAVVTASAIVAVAAGGKTNDPGTRPIDSTAESLTPSPAPSPSPSPSQLSLSQYFDRWRNGPVKVSVEHYNSWVRRAEAKDEADYTEFDVRVGIRNESTTTLDLATAPQSLVLVTNAKFPDDVDFIVAPQRIAEVPSAWNLWAVGFDNEPGSIEVNGKENIIQWTGSQLAVGFEFTSSSTANNGIIYHVPAPSRKAKGEVDAISPSRVNVLGLAWIGSDGIIQGFAPTAQWTGPNSIESFTR